MTAALADDLTDLRLTLHRNAYRPVPVLGPHVATKSAGKRPAMKSWEAVCATADETEITRWTNAQRNCTNTGLLCGNLIGIDIDVLDEGKAAHLTKGRGGPGIPVWPRRPTRTNKGKIPLFIVGVDAVKDAVYARLKLTEPGPGAIHFPRRLDADYFR